MRERFQSLLMRVIERCTDGRSSGLLSLRYFRGPSVEISFLRALRVLRNLRVESGRRRSKLADALSLEKLWELLS